MKSAILWFAVLCVTANAQSNILAARRAPGFSLPDQKMKQHDMHDYRGKVVVLDFMRTDCPKCQALTPVLEKLKAAYGNKLQLLAVVPANGVDNFQTVSKYVAEHKSTSPFLFDCGQMSASYLQVTPQNPRVHLPSVIVVDKAGMIRATISEETAGGLTMESLTAVVDPLTK